MLWNRPTDGPTDRPTDGPTDGHTLLWRCENDLKKAVCSLSHNRSALTKEETAIYAGKRRQRKAETERQRGFLHDPVRLLACVRACVRTRVHAYIRKKIPPRTHVYSKNVKNWSNVYQGYITYQLINFNPTLNGVPIQWVDEWKYLGVVLRSGTRYGCSVTERVKAFYRALNAILRIEGRSNDLILLQLIEAHCVPILSYAIEVVTVFNRDERRSLRVAYNSIFRKIFGYRSFESVTNLQHSLRRFTWEELVEKRKAGFMKRARSGTNDTLVGAFC